MKVGSHFDEGAEVGGAVVGSLWKRWKPSQLADEAVENLDELVTLYRGEGWDVGASPRIRMKSGMKPQELEQMVLGGNVPNLPKVIPHITETAFTRHLPENVTVR